MICLCHALHSLFSLPPPASPSLFSLFSSSSEVWKISSSGGCTSRGDDLSLSLLSVWAETEEKYHPWQDPSQEYSWDSTEFQSGLYRHLSTRLIGIPHISKGTPKDKEDVKEKGDESQANLTARLIGAMFEMDSSLSSRVISKALCRLSPDILLPICFSGPISRCIMDSFWGCKSNNRERTTLLTSFVLVRM